VQEVLNFEFFFVIRNSSKLPNMSLKGRLVRFQAHT
jgi:hypothetical protein